MYSSCTVNAQQEKNPDAAAPYTTAAASSHPCACPAQPLLPVSCNERCAGMELSVCADTGVLSTASPL